MASPTLIAGILGLLGTFGAAFIIAGLWIWRHTTSLGGEVQDRINEIENNQQSKFSAELADLYLSIEKKLEMSDSIPEDMKRDEHIVNIIYREVEEDDLDSIVEELDKIGDTRELWNRHKFSYNNAWKHCFSAAITLFATAAILTLATAADSDPFNGGFIIIYFLAFVYFFDRTQNAYTEFNQANKLHDHFEEKWEEYKLAD